MQISMSGLDLTFLKSSNHHMKENITMSQDNAGRPIGYYYDEFAMTLDEDFDAKRAADAGLNRPSQDFGPMTSVLDNLCRTTHWWLKRDADPKNPRSRNALDYLENSEKELQAYLADVKSDSYDIETDNKFWNMYLRVKTQRAFVNFLQHLHDDLEEMYIVHTGNKEYVPNSVLNGKGARKISAADLAKFGIAKTDAEQKHEEEGSKLIKKEEVEPPKKEKEAPVEAPQSTKDAPKEQVTTASADVKPVVSEKKGMAALKEIEERAKKEAEKKKTESTVKAQAVDDVEADTVSFDPDPKVIEEEEGMTFTETV